MQDAVEVREELQKLFRLRASLGGGEQRTHDFHRDARNLRLVFGRHVGESWACRPVGVLHVDRVPPLEVVEGASWSRASWRVQQENDLLRGHAIFTRDVVNHLSPNYALRKIGHPAPVLEDGLQQQAALLFGPVQAMFPSKP